MTLLIEKTPNKDIKFCKSGFKSLVFDGINDYVSYSADTNLRTIFNSDNAFSVCARFRIIVPSVAHIFSAYNPDTSGFFVSFSYFPPSNAQFQFYFKVSATQALYLLFLTNVVHTTGEDVKLVMTYNGGKVAASAKCYYNGSELTSILIGSNNLVSGIVPAPGNFFTGLFQGFFVAPERIGDLRIYPRVLTLTEIANYSIYNKPALPLDFLRNWDYDQNSGLIVPELATSVAASVIGQTVGNWQLY